MASNDPEADPAFLESLAEAFPFSPSAIRHLWRAVGAGAGDMAMFDHPELGGPGQWMRGGLILIGRPDDRVLKNRIDELCHRLSEHLRAGEGGAPGRVSPNARAWDVMAAPVDSGWPAELGTPSATGQSNDLAYAYFRQTDRLAVRRGADNVAIYDTRGITITGMSQSQSDGTSRIVFTSPEGPVALNELTRVDAASATPSRPSEQPATHDATPSAPTSESSGQDTIFSALERLGELRDKGVLTEAEFSAKKQELLDRL